MHSCLTAYVRRQPSHTVVIESAIYLLRQGVCHIKGKQIMNAKWALAFLHFAVWVQLKKSMQWIETDVLQDTDSVHATSCHELQALFGSETDAKGVALFIMILTGAGGTGKSTIVKTLEAFAEFWLGVECIRKSAPTNTAARVIGGDTCHAVYKLPFGTLKGRRGHFSPKVLNIFQEQWAWDTACAHVIDEFSFLSPGDFFQMDIRSRTAKAQRESRFGGFATLLTGDFFQLPHPTKPSLATPVDAETKDLARCSDEGVAEHESDEKDKVNEKETAQSEHRAGKDAWLAIPKVVMLSLNLRSPGMLANILQDVRNQHITDATWRALQQRVLGTGWRGDSLVQVCEPGSYPPLQCGSPMV